MEYAYPVYDPLLVDANMPLDPRLVNFFEETGADPSNDVNDQRYLIACQNCNRNERRMTPEACNQCDQYMLGIQQLS